MVVFPFDYMQHSKNLQAKQGDVLFGTITLNLIAIYVMNNFFFPDYNYFIKSQNTIKCNSLPYLVFDYYTL